MRVSHRGRALMALFVLTLLVAAPLSGASGAGAEDAILVTSLPELAQGERAGPGWVAARLDLEPERTWSLGGDLSNARPHAALGLFVYDAHDNVLGRVLAVAPESGTVRYHVSSNWAPLRFETGSGATGTTYGMGIRLTMSCGTCEPATLRVVLVAAGAFDTFRWSVSGEGTTLGGLTEGAGAFAYRATDFRGPLVAEAQREEAALEAVVNGWRDLDVTGRLVALFADLSGNPLTDLRALAPEGHRACPCVFPDGERTGGSGAYGFRATTVGEADDLLLFGANVVWP